MTYLVVTPARNEAERLPALAASLAHQERGVVGHWVVVDDGSTDGTAESLPPDLPFPCTVLRREPGGGGLATGSAFASFLHGAAVGLELLPEAERVLKIDADVVLDRDHLAALRRHAGGAGLVGGVLCGEDEVERADHTRGALKAYDRQAFELVRGLPAAIGFDVLDEALVRAAGLDVRVVPSAVAEVTRRTGSSEGLLRGRRRGGRVSRWTGYHPVYFVARLIRYVARKPYVIGSLAMAWGYATAGRGPYPEAARHALRREQAFRLRRMVADPVHELREHFRRW